MFGPRSGSHVKGVEEREREGGGWMLACVTRVGAGVGWSRCNTVATDRGGVIGETQPDIGYGRGMNRWKRGGEEIVLTCNRDCLLLLYCYQPQMLKSLYIHW